MTGNAGGEMADRDTETKKLKRKIYEKKLRKLQVELCRVQDWVKATGAKIIVVFEGRDAAGKGGTIKEGPAFRRREILTRSGDCYG